MSFLADAPLLYAAGEVYARGTRPPESTAEESQEVALGTITILSMWALSVPLYLNRGWTRPVWRFFFANSGRDWMVNSGVLRIDPERIGTRGHMMAGALFALYPLWLWLGYRRVRKAQAGRGGPGA